MQIVMICQCDHEEFSHNFVEDNYWAEGQGCFKCPCTQFKADNLKSLEKAIGPTVSVQNVRPQL